MMDPITSLLIPAGLFVLIGSSVALIYQVPLRISICGSWREGIGEGYACIGWGLLDLCIRPGSTGMGVEARIWKTRLISWKAEGKKPGTDLPSERSGGSKHDVRLLLRFLPVMKKVIPLMIHHLRIGKITGSARCGAGDPVTTGLIYGYYQAIIPLIADRCSLVLIPVFDQLFFEAELGVKIQITRPFGLLVKGTALVLPVILREKKTGRTFPQGRTVYG